MMSEAYALAAERVASRHGLNADKVLSRWLDGLGKLLPELERELDTIDHLDIRPYCAGCGACQMAVAKRIASGRALPEGVAI